MPIYGAHRYNASKPFAGGLRGASILRQGLVFAALLNELSTQCRDDAGGTYGLVGSAGPTWVDGLLSFDSSVGTTSTNVMKWGFAPNTWNLPLGAFSVAARLLWKGTESGIIESNPASANAGWSLAVGDTNNVCGMHIFRASTNLRAYGPSFTKNRFVNLVVTVDGSLTAAGVKIYVDGVLQTQSISVDGSGAVTGEPASTNDGPRLGTRQFSSGTTVSTSSFNGFMDVIHLWNRALTVGEVLEFQRDPYFAWHTRSFLALSPFQFGAPQTYRFRAVETAQVQGPGIRQQAVETITFLSPKIPAQESLVVIPRPATTEALESETVGTGSRTKAMQSEDIQDGDGQLLMIDAMDSILDDARN